MDGKETKIKSNPTDPIAHMESHTANAAGDEERAKKKDTRYSIHVHSIRKKLCDADGISAKAAIDGLVIGKILPDDSPKYVEEVTYSQKKGNREETIISIYEVIDNDK